MASTSAEEAVLVVRIWREPGVAGFRGRVTYRADVSDTAEAVVVVDSEERLHAAVQGWLDAFALREGPRS
jgi:hypothetical protein